MKIEYRLQFSDVFPEEEKKEILYYLREIPKNILLECIGFFTRIDLPTFAQFFSDESNRKDINKRLSLFMQSHKLEQFPIIISREASLSIIEQVLYNKEELLENNSVVNNVKEAELAMFKCFLIENEKINSRYKSIEKTDIEGIDTLAKFLIAVKFSTADLALYDDYRYELSKLLYSTIYKLRILFTFLSGKKHKYLLEEMCRYFGVKDKVSLEEQVRYLLGRVFLLICQGEYSFKEDNVESREFLNALVSKQIIIPEKDFINLRNYPLYKKDESTYMIIDPFFIMDKFTTSIKFILKEVYNRHNNLSDKSRDFFNFYNTTFSEQYLMREVLNQIFSKKYFIKMKNTDIEKGRPDYYCRIDKRIFLFEYKDNLISKEIKVSDDIDKIFDLLRRNYLIDTKGRPIGIGQLVNHIKNINDRVFEYDDVNNSKVYTIYPILILSNRMLEIHGVNYILNKWFKESVSTLQIKKLVVKDLLLIDIDTFIFFQNNFKEDIRVFEKQLDFHIKAMSNNHKGYGNNYEEFELNVKKKIEKKLEPISVRISKKIKPKNDLMSMLYNEDLEIGIE
ncbi:hypothetical protein [Capnocytophaga ochracea]|uniref:Uncharacterized protein n=1 Tax=Capnocytophaga ochracea TaxID=1018 RepID=A0AA46W9I2_CAPOC|nr:hypothetical protein [Capnocytophaga ochracea]UZD40082.1 hypothetical protein OL231_07790 [Capnocytophaga ochracea]